MKKTLAQTALSSQPVSDDLLKNVLLDGICGDIQFVMNHGRKRAALTLILSGIDAMAALEKSAEPGGVKNRFVAWVNEYMEFDEWPEAGLEIYGARCGMLHTYGPISDLSEAGRVRPIVYTSGGGKVVLQSAELVIVCIERLALRFFRGIAKYLDVLITDNEKRALATPRLLQMFHELDLNSESRAP